MLKKIFVCYTVISFLFSTIAIQSMAYTRNCRDNCEEEQVSSLKNRFRTLQKLVLITLKLKNSGNPYKEAALKGIKRIIDYNIDRSVAELKNPEYRRYLTTYSDVLSKNTHYENLTKPVIKAIYSHADDRAGHLQLVRSRTLIGVPIGLVINLCAWVVYGIALLFEDTIPILGLFIYTISIIMTGIGWYFIL